MRRIGEQHLGDAVELGGRLGDGAGSRAPATRTWTSPPSALAAVRALAVAALSVVVVVLGEKQNGHSDHPRFVLQLGDQLGDGRDLDAGLARRRLDRLQHLQARRDVDAEIGRASSSSSGFFFAFMMLGSEA